jgi:hypothetical protein
MLFNDWPENGDGDRYHTCPFECISEAICTLASKSRTTSNDPRYKYRLPILGLTDSDRFTEEFQLVEFC